MAGVAYDYAGLVAALEVLLEDAFTDFTDFVDQLIGRGESQLLKDLDLELWDTTDTSVSTVSGNSSVNKPASTIAIRSVRINGVDLEPRSYELVRDYNLAASNGQPKYFNEYNETTIIVAPPPNAIMAVEYDVIGRPKQLGAANDATHATTTFLSTFYGDLLLTGCLIKCEEFEIADDRAAMWKQSYAEAMSGARRELTQNRRAYAFGPPVATPAPEPAPAG